MSLPPVNPIKPQDLILLRTLRKLGVLTDVKKGQIEMKTGAVVVACPDCHQDPENRAYLYALCHASCMPVLLQFTPGHNGGPLAIPANSPLNRSYPYQSQVGINNIKGALAIKKLDNIVILVAHTPCGIAEVFGLSLFDIITITLEAKETIKKEMNVKVPCLLHVDYNGSARTPETGPLPHGHKTYFFSGKLWQKYLQSLPLLG